MTQTISRKQFLRGDIGNRHTPVRPPWAYGENEFVDRCSRCDRCIQHCPSHILIRDKHGFPVVDFSMGECQLCRECVDRCEPAALSDDLIDSPWCLKANITEQCFVYRGVHCMVCREQCEKEAITFTYRAGLPPMPSINTAECNGCGACYKPCPQQAINMAYQHTKNNQSKENAS